jgi:hypothetical protein
VRWIVRPVAFELQDVNRACWWRLRIATMQSQ